MLTDEELRARIERRLDEIGRSAIEAANKGNLERSYIRDFLLRKKESVKSKFHEAIAMGLDWTVQELLADPAPVPQTAPAALPESLRAAPAPLPSGQMPLDVPVLGLAAGGTTADFLLNGQVIDYVRRPPRIAKMSGVFALFVAGTSMYPRYHDGELIYVTSSRAPSIGDYVVIELYPADEGPETPGFVKQLKRRTASKVVCTQFNPAKDLEFDLKRVKAIHRVLPWNEVLGA